MVLMACIQEKGRLLERIPLLARFGTIRSNGHYEGSAALTVRWLVFSLIFIQLIQILCQLKPFMYRLSLYSHTIK